MLTFAEAVKIGLERNHQIVKMKEKVASLQRKLKEIENRDDWEWEANLEGRIVSDNTTTTSNKRMASLELEKRFPRGLTITPEFYLKEDDLLEDGLSRDDINFAVNLEEQIYPLELGDNEKYYLKTELRLVKARVKLWQVREEKLIDCLADYFSLIELKIEREIEEKKYEISKRQLKKEQEAYQTGKSDRQDLLKAKIDLTKAQRYWEETKNDYHKCYRELSQELGLTKDENLEVATDKAFNLESIAKIEVELPTFQDREQLLDLAIENSKQLWVHQLEREQIKKEEEWQKDEEKPKVDVNADYDSDSDEWQVALNITDKLFNRSDDKLAQEELAADLEALNREKDEYLQELKVEIGELVGEITVNQLKVKEEKLKLKRSKLELESSKEELISKDLSQLKYDLGLLDIKEDQLGLKEKEHELLLSKYELIKLLGVLEFD
ncbi:MULTISPECIES: TolC family protein [unclassified Candidatus Frackibacter]|uniref:TolC family protein n=1 Tax=unclassified Candidatus Frackibacter TaxID=2648818 RepID=UPI00087F40AB|nr:MULTISPECIES: TolC family protein [unclassified Candidatus Frackibacter]SDC38518.1 Outer membrane efflux protein [Candidatus Frackibacter sp. WG11]SEM61784.1 Outer membrane efflux protein [Candidatus Frackibacter sp. WG12]SFL66199.1 Outer membrane efflux protein [Candidatus Frackibacter sp. WG13]